MGKKKTFHEWKNEVNALVEAKVGLGVDDLPDWDFTTAYDNGVSPKVAAARCIAYAREC